MASSEKVKTYLAYWLQLGQGIRMLGPEGGYGAQLVRPGSVLADGQYSDSFEALWQKLQQPEIASQAHLWGTEQTIAQLLSSSWEIGTCSLCRLPVPLTTAGLPINSSSCPCSEIKPPPNLELCPPREPINSQVMLKQMCDRL
jgi:hypothetical protein